ncbi:tumor necrosis factor receptor superfamily member 21 [Corythoichthys intestinalis]|uniref:tumor necrosis factor receptor superfamily member 21 n=1 Tax=Corythoichthys intestinalis TaxID=161448 RepID=UPI0025A5CEE8|nr:tumor necrosis factor receptor superfamily member 21 [Corythoichthys intestinalis]
MSAMCISAVVLWTLVVEISARVLSTTHPADLPLLSSRHYQYKDPDSGFQLVCDKCPAGTHVSAHCSLNAVRECSPCPEGTFTRGENGVSQCHHCRTQCPVGQIEKLPCTATQDRVCTCPPNSFLSMEGGKECKQHSLCPPGTRVKKRGSETEDVICKPCTKGTFSDLESSALKCQAHSNCKAQGLMLLKVGTRETDNLCGPPSTSHSSTFSSTTTAQRQKLVTSESSSSTLDHKGINSRSAAIQVRENQERKLEVKIFSNAQSTSPAIYDSQTSPPIARKHLVHHKQQWDKTKSDPLHGPKKRTVEGFEGSEVRVGIGINKIDVVSNRDSVSNFNRPTRRGSPRPSPHDHFDINEHLPWMIVLLLLLVLVVIVMCSVKRSSRMLKKGPMEDPSSIVGRAIQKKPSLPPTQVKEKWIYYSNGQGVDILKLVAAQVGPQWIDIYHSLASATEREVAAFSSGYSSDHERAYAALQHWTIRDSDANLAKLINALHRQRRIDIVEKIRLVMEDNPQFDINQLMTSVNVSQSLSPIHKPQESPISIGGTATGVEQSPVDRTKGFFHDESEPLLRCDSTSSKDSALSRNGSFITKEKKDTVLRQVRLDPCDLQPIFDDMLHILNPEELHVIEEIPAAEDKLDQLFEIAGVKSQEASQTLLDSVYSHLPDLL